jgi:serine/threonine protein kinase
VSLSVDPRIGSELFGYRLDAPLGRGGMGVVYKAHDPRLKRNVAVKLIAPELSDDEGIRERFLAESELAASLDHPNVVPIYDAFDAEGRLAIAMPGSSIRALTADEAVALAVRELTH